MLGRATIKGHPIHPMLIPFPIGFFVGALICDIISVWGDPTFWPRMSVTLIGFGIIGALLAALFGFIDYFTIAMPPAVKNTATVHMVLNLLMVLIFVIAFFIRIGNDFSVIGHILTILGVIVLAFSGYLGGKLAHVAGVGVSQGD